MLLKNIVKVKVKVSFRPHKAPSKLQNDCLFQNDPAFYCQLAMLPAFCLAVDSKLHQSKPFHVSKETMVLCVHKHHGVSLSMDIWHRINAPCSFDDWEFEMPISDFK